MPPCWESPRAFTDSNQPLVSCSSVSQVVSTLGSSHPVGLSVRSVYRQPGLGQSPTMSLTEKDIAGRSRPPAPTHGLLHLLTLPNTVFLVGKRVRIVEHDFYIYVHLLFLGLGSRCPHVSVNASLRGRGSELEERGG